MDYDKMVLAVCGRELYMPDEAELGRVCSDVAREQIALASMIQGRLSLLHFSQTAIDIDSFYIQSI